MMDTTGLLKNGNVIYLDSKFDGHSTTSNAILIEDNTDTPMAYKTINTLIPRISSTPSNYSDEKFSLEKLKINKRRLISFLHLPKNWNGYGGEVISQSVITKTTNLIAKLDFQPQIFPTGRGSIQIEDEIDDNNFYEIEISEESTFAYLVQDGKETEKGIEVNKVAELVNKMYV